MDEAYNFLINDAGIKDGDSVVVACSGGPDSMALLSLILDVRKSININIVVAHVNHNVRVESADEMVFVRDFCSSNNLIFEYMKIDNYSSDNFESEARGKRYSFFDSIVSKYGACCLLTAHHGDDLMETILMRITRGSTMSGYCGFSRISLRNGYSIIRPLIHLTKADILDYNSNMGIDFVIDKTNFLDVHTRNRYRKYVLPVLKNEDVCVHDKFYKFSSVIQECDDFVERQVDSAFGNVYYDGVLDIEKFLSLDSFICKRIIYRILKVFYGSDLYCICDKHVSMILDLINSNRSNSNVDLPMGFIGVKEYNCFKIIKKNDFIYYDYVFNDKVLLGSGKCIEKVKSTSVNDNNVIRLCSGDLCLPLHVRSRKNGDKIHIKGMSGSRKVKDVFIDCKIPISERFSWPIVVDSNDEIVWIPGLKKSIFDTNSEKCDIILRYY